MDLKPVKSSNISHIGYDAATKTLGVRFSGGNEYHYADVDADQHAALIGAESIGRHFATHIRGKFNHTKIEKEKA